MEIDRCDFRGRTAVHLIDRSPQLKAVLMPDGRPGVIFSALDLIGGLLGARSGDIDGYDPETAFDLMRNIVLYAGGLEAAPVKLKDSPIEKPADNKKGPQEEIGDEW